MPVSHHGPAFQLRRWVRCVVWCGVLVTIFLLLERSGAPFYMSAQAANEGPSAPHAPLPTTLNDFLLPGTQPNTLDEPLQGCTGCHVDHLSRSYAGSMMANSARDLLFRAALRVANEDAAFGGEFCIRCHVPNAWLNGRSQSGTGSNFTAADMNGVTCNVCHRLVAPHAVTGEAARNPGERSNIQVSQQTSLIIGSGAYVIDRDDYRRGPFGTNAGTHKTQQDTFMRSSLMCATCHEIDNPLFTYDPNTQEFVLNPLDQPAPVGAKLFPIERTYSEWQFSAFNTPAGVGGLSDLYPGIKRQSATEDGPITVCQDCHMPLIESPLVTTNGATSLEVGKHEWAGGSARWQVAIEDFWDGVANDVLFDNISEAATLESTQLGLQMLQRAAELQIRFNDRTIMISVVNNTGHKLPTGYAEGRRMWLQVGLISNGDVISTYGSYDDNGYIINPLKVYEIKLGLTEQNATAIGRPELAGEGFHFSLNNKVFKDNRIPPRGWTNAQYATKSMQPVGAVYTDGVYTDTTTLQLPDGVDQVEIKLWYQTASGEYLDFLEAEADDLVPDAVFGTSVNWGSIVGLMREKFDLDAPVQMASSIVSVPDLALDKSASPTSTLLPGQPLTFTLTFSNPGFVGIANVGIADTVPSSVSNVTVETDLANSVSLIQTGNAPKLAWNVDGFFDSSDNSRILIRGIVNPQLNVDTVINNTAVMSGNVGANVINRTAQASVNVVVPRVQFVPSAYMSGEDAGAVEVTVKMDKANPFAATTLRVSTQEGSAKAGDDFVALSDLQVTIPAGETTATFSVQLVNDDEAEFAQSFTVVIKNATGAALGATSSATITIEDEDPGTPVLEDDLFLPAAQK